MSAISEQARFLGVNWRSLWRELRKPWLQAHRWPLVVALTPAAFVRLMQVDGRASVWTVDANGEMREQAAEGRARFFAIELPEEMLLRRNIAVPALGDDEIKQAIAIDVRSNNPFPPDDLRWAYKTVGSSAVRGRRVEAVLASHRQISALLARSAERTPPQGATPEVWARVDAHQYVVLNGYGEHKRARFGARGRRIAYALVATVAMLVGAIAITPTLQLRSRAIEAVNAYTAAFQRAAPLMREREALVRSADQIQTLNKIVQERADPVEVLDMLTRVLTDDTSLRSLQIQGLKVNIEGQTGNAAELMQLLGRQPGFRDVVAPTAATRPFGAAKDNFKIEFMLEPKKMADTQPKAGDSLAVAAPMKPQATATAPSQVASVPVSTSAAAMPKVTP